MKRNAIKKIEAGIRSVEMGVGLGEVVRVWSSELKIEPEKLR